MKEELQQQKESQIAAQLSTSLGYSNTENPFGDSNLGAKFVWQKKREQEVKKGLSNEERMRIEAAKREEAERELEKLKRARKEREIEMQLMEEEQAKMQREADRAALGDWEARENEFQLEQAKRRAQIRIAEGRAKPIDILAMNVSLATDSELASEFDALGVEMEMDEPYHLFQDLTLNEIKELHSDIKLYLTLEKDETTIPFWQCMMIVCEDELSRHTTDPSTLGVPVSVLADIDTLLASKSLVQLQLLQTQVEAKLASGGPVDVDYWEALMKSLLVFKAKAKLREMHASMLKKRLEQLKDKMKEEVDKVAQELVESENVQVADQLSENEEEIEDVMDDEYHREMSPEPITNLGREDRDIDIVDEETDWRQIVRKTKRKMNSRYFIF